MATGIYNITIDPLVTEAQKLGIERNVTFSSAATHFLQSHGFDFADCITNGVTYLSRPEVTQALVDYRRRLDDKNSTTAQFVAGIAPHDHETIAFVRGAKKRIEGWISEVASNKTQERSVDISIDAGTHARYHRKLVHDMLRTQFKDYRGYQPSFEATFMTIEKINVEKEEKIAAGRKGVYEEALKNEIGFRYIIETLATGGDITKIPTSMFIVSQDGANSCWLDAGKIERDLIDIQTKLEKKPRTIVGHNMFMDMAFVYQTFIGDLPESVVDFQSTIHALFPQVIDTKFIATSAGHAGFQDSSSLSELHNKYKNKPTPIIEVPAKFNGYANKEKLHEAGYDSFLCAQAYVRMVSQMQTLDSSKPASLPLLLDINHPWYETYMNKLRVFRTVEIFCDLDPVPCVAMAEGICSPFQGSSTPSAPHHRFAGPSQDIRNRAGSQGSPPFSAAFSGTQTQQFGQLLVHMGPRRFSGGSQDVRNQSQGSPPFQVSSGPQGQVQQFGGIAAQLGATGGGLGSGFQSHHQGQGFSGSGSGRRASRGGRGGHFG